MSLSLCQMKRGAIPQPCKMVPRQHPAIPPNRVRRIPRTSRAVPFRKSSRPPSPTQPDTNSAASTTAAFPTPPRLGRTGYRLFRKA